MSITPAALSPPAKNGSQTNGVDQSETGD